MVETPRQCLSVEVIIRAGNALRNADPRQLNNS